MQKLKETLNPLDIPYAIQSELLRVTEGDDLLMLSEPDFLNALKLQGDIHSLRFAPYELNSEQGLKDNLKHEVINAKTIFIIIETLEEESIKKYSHIFNYISSIVDDEVTLFIDTKIVEKILYEPITILLFGYESNEKFLLEVGDDFAEFWSKNSEYCLNEFKQMREKISKQIKESVSPIRITSTSRSPNIVELVDAQSFQALRVFEFNFQTKEEFIHFLQKLEITLVEYLKRLDT